MYAISYISFSGSPAPHYETAVLRSYCWRGFNLSPSRICSSFYTTLALNTINCKRFIKINPLPQIWTSQSRCARARAIGRGGRQGLLVHSCAWENALWLARGHCRAGQQLHTGPYTPHTYPHAHWHPIPVPSHMSSVLSPICKLCSSSGTHTRISHMHFIHIPCQPITTLLYTSHTCTP